MEIPDDRISCCIRILQQFQQSHLLRLSIGAGRIVDDLINGAFWSSNASRFEELEERDIIAFANVPGASYDYLFQN